MSASVHCQIGDSQRGGNLPEVYKRVLCMLNSGRCTTVPQWGAPTRHLAWRRPFVPFCGENASQDNLQVLTCAPWVLTMVATGLLMPQSDNFQCLNDWRAARHCLCDGNREMGITGASSSSTRNRENCMHAHMQGMNTMVATPLSE